MTDSEGSTMTIGTESFELFLGRYYSVFLYVRCDPEVVVPDYLRTLKWSAGEEHVVLEYGLDMSVPVDDLVVDARGVAATLSFSRVPCHTFVPWGAVELVRGSGVRSATPSRPKLKLVP